MTFTRLPFEPVGDGVVAFRLAMTVRTAGEDHPAIADVVTAFKGAQEVSLRFVGSVPPGSILPEQTIASAALAG